ncbi:MAG: hypothetical protein KDI44_18255, partial [Thiothrix sp.]|nr:hypothetical protein [Thiothrix sp.]
MSIEFTSLLDKISSNRFLTTEDRNNILDTVHELRTDLQTNQEYNRQLSNRLHNRDAVIEELEKALAQREKLIFGKEELLQKAQNY